MDRHAEGGDRECECQGRVQEIADHFVDVEECHWGFPSCRMIGSDQVRNDADGDADQRQGEGDRHGGVQEVAQIFFVENGHCCCSVGSRRRDWRRTIDRMFGARAA